MAKREHGGVTAKDNRLFRRRCSGGFDVGSMLRNTGDVRIWGEHDLEEDA